MAWTTITGVEPEAAVVPVTDAVLVDAVDQARAAVVEDAGAAAIGEHLGVVMEEERLAAHAFACELPGYRGWRWAVTLARVPDGSPTVCDVVLLPGADAVVAPPWVPWSERVQPGDLGPGDILPTRSDDPRLVPGYTGEGELAPAEADEPLTPTGWELGLGRIRVLSSIGRDDAADRWIDGETGPASAMAKNAPMPCSTCGFLLPMGGAFGQAFGVCANRMSPGDGRVVSLDYGCGAHSEAHVEDVPATLDLETAEETATELGHS